MTLEKIREFHRASPFRSFDMFLADGRVVRVTHPEFLFIRGRTITVFEDADIGEIIDLLLVISLKPLKLTRAVHSNN